MKRIVFCLLGTILCVTNVCSQELSHEEKETMKQRVVECYNDFLSYLPEIAAKTGQEERRIAAMYIEKALSLFVGNGYEYQCYDMLGDSINASAVRVSFISKDGVPSPPRSLRVYLNRLTALKYVRFKLALDTAKLKITRTPYMPKNALYSVIAKNEKPIAYIFSTTVETSEGYDVLYFPKLTDITLIEE